MKLTENIKSTWIENFPLPIFIIDASMQLKYANQKATGSLKKQSENIYIETILGIEILPYLSQFKHMLNTNKFGVFDVFLEKYGETKVFGTSLDESEIGILLIIVPQYFKSLYKEIKEEKKLLLKYINMPIITTDADMNILDVNPAFSTVFGYTKEHAIGKKPTLLKSGKQDDTFYKKMFQDLENKNLFCGELIDKKESGELNYIKTTIFPIKEKNDVTKKYYAILEDITDIKKLHEHVNSTNTKDTLTGVYNRESFFSMASVKIELSNEQNSLGVFFIDLDKFKSVNDIYGHTAGDFVLSNAAKRINDTIRTSDILGRFGGDEFVVLLENMNYEKAEYVAQKIINNLEKPYKFGKDTISFLSASIGIAIAPFDGHTLDELIEKSDAAMYEAKRSTNVTNIIKAQNLLENKNIKNIKSEFFKAIKNDEIYIRMQPIVSMKDKSIKGCEVLARWLNLYFNEVSPETFIPIAITHNLIEKFDIHILNLTIKMFQNNNTNDENFIHVNFSGQLFSNVNFLQKIRTLIEAYPILCDILIIEITEQTLMENIELAAEYLSELKLLGIRIAIDDFGTGFSSLSYLKHFDIDYLKIDISFIQDILEHEKNLKIVETIIFLAQAIGAKTIAEGIETNEQYEVLKRLGVDYGQGYYFDYPLLPMSYFQKL